MEKKKSVKSQLDVFLQAIAAGIMISVGGTVYLQCDNKIFGSFIFSVGLLSIVIFGFNLYTGKVGYIPFEKPSYILKVLLILLGNICGTFISAYALKLTRFYDTLKEKVSVLAQSKISDTLLSTAILAIFCGILMYIAVDGYKRATEKKLHTPATFIVIMPIMTFILAGFNHSIADMYYLFLDGITAKKVLYLAIVAIGNAAGSMIISLLQSLKKSN